MNPDSIAIIQNRIEGLRKDKDRLLDALDAAESADAEAIINRQYREVFLRERELTWVLGVL